MRRQHYCTVSGCVKFYWILSDPLQSFVEREVLCGFFLSQNCYFLLSLKEKQSHSRGRRVGGEAWVCVPRCGEPFEKKKICLINSKTVEETKS